MQPTSIEAFKQIESSGLVSKLRLEVTRLIYEHPGLTQNELVEVYRQEGSRKRQDHSITPRFAELILRDVIQEEEIRECRITGRKVLTYGPTFRQAKPLVKREKKSDDTQALLSRIELLEKLIRKAQEIGVLPQGLRQEMAQAVPMPEGQGELPLAKG